MRTLTFVRSFVCTMAAYFAFTAPLYAQIVPLSDETMGNVTAQAGIAISANDLGFNIKADTIYYGDKDGLGQGTGTTAGYLSLTGVDLDGSVNFGKPLTIDVATTKDPSGATQITSVNMTLSDMTLKIDKFYIDAIRLGSAPGQGPSLGSFGINNMVVKMTGNISITAN